MIMAHDAASTYLSESGIIKPWAKTQPSGGANGLLNCGARAFDWRPFLQPDGTIYAYHGDITIKHAMEKSLDEMIGWANANQNGAFDLVIIGIDGTKGVDDNNRTCLTAVQELLVKKNISIVTPTAMKKMTAQDVVNKGKLSGGGSIVACFSCWVPHYQTNPLCTCSGFEKEFPFTYTCFASSKTKSYPLNRLWKYLDNTSAVGPPKDGYLYSHQALWQENAADVTVGTLHGSSLLEDESKSKLNSLLAARITSGEWNVSKANMIEINNVCDGGIALKNILDHLPDN